jgi:hypothetical protein
MLAQAQSDSAARHSVVRAAACGAISDGSVEVVMGITRELLAFGKSA